MKWKDRGFYKRYLYTIRLNNLIKRCHVTVGFEKGLKLTRMRYNKMKY